MRARLHQYRTKPGWANKKPREGQPQRGFYYASSTHRLAAFNSSGVPGQVRTANLPLRRGMLYPIELLRHKPSRRNAARWTASMLNGGPAFVMSSVVLIECRQTPLPAPYPHAGCDKSPIPSWRNNSNNRTTVEDNTLELSSRNTPSALSARSPGANKVLRASRASISSTLSRPLRSSRLRKISGLTVRRMGSNVG